MAKHKYLSILFLFFCGLMPFLAHWIMTTPMMLSFDKSLCKILEWCIAFIMFMNTHTCFTQFRLNMTSCVHPSISNPPCHINIWLSKMDKGSNMLRGAKNCVDFTKILQPHDFDWNCFRLHKYVFWNEWIHYPHFFHYQFFSPHVKTLFTLNNQCHTLGRKWDHCGGHWRLAKLIVC
jgi:hypothetical protein